MGEKIRKSITGNDILEIRMNTSIGQADARAIDLKYHLKCYMKQKRLSEIDDLEDDASSVNEHEVRIRSAELEFFSLLESHICEGK